MWHPASDRPEAPRSLLHDRGHKFLQTLQASTSPPYIQTPRDPRRSITCCRWLLDRLHVEKRSFINWRELDRVPWSRFGLLLSGWRCNPAAQSLSCLYIMEEAQPDSSALCASLLPLTLLQYNNSSRENIMSHHDFMSFTSIIFKNWRRTANKYWIPLLYVPNAPSSSNSRKIGLMTPDDF